MTRWVYETASGKWMVGFRDPSRIHTQPTAYAEADLPDAYTPDPVTERYDAGAGVRPATPAEVLESKREEAVIDMNRVLVRDQVFLALALVVAELQGITPAQMRARVIAKYRELKES